MPPMAPAGGGTRGMDFSAAASVLLLLLLLACGGRPASSTTTAAFSFRGKEPCPARSHPRAGAGFRHLLHPPYYYCVWDDSVQKNKRRSSTIACGAAVDEEEDGDQRQNANSSKREARTFARSDPPLLLEPFAPPPPSPEKKNDRIAVANNNDSSNDTISSNSSNNTANVTSSVLLLNLVAILWGSQHALIKTVVSDTSNPAAFTLLRFGLAALLASPYTPALPSWSLWQHQNNPQEDDTDTLTTKNNDTWRWGCEMGFWMFLGFGFQAIGLEFTTAQRSGFLLYLNVKFVPFLAYVLLGRRISAATWASALTAFVGTALLTLDAGEGGRGSSSSINVGDLWTIAAAAASAMFILRLERASSQVPDAAALNAACLWVVTVLAGAWTVAQLGFALAANDAAAATASAPNELLWTELVRITTTHPLELIYLGGVTTALANWVQTKAQRDISAERASVIYATDPVWGAGFSYILLGETLNGAASWVGAGLITLAAATNAFLDVSGNQKEEEDEAHRKQRGGAKEADVINLNDEEIQVDSKR